MLAQINFENEKLRKYEEFTLIYSGPSFNSGVKIDKLINNLNSIQNLIYTLSDVNKEYKKSIYGRENILQIRVLPKNGTFEEIIQVVFANPEMAYAIGGALLAIFLYLLSRRDTTQSENRLNERLDEIEEVIARGQSKNIQGLYNPLEKKEDSLTLVENGEEKVKVNADQKKDLDDSISKIEKEIELEESTEELEGYISAINIDTNWSKFHANSMTAAYSLGFDIPIPKLLSVVGRQIKAQMKVTKFKHKIIRFHLLSYTLMQKGVGDF